LAMGMPQRGLPWGTVTTDHCRSTANLRAQNPASMNVSKMQLSWSWRTQALIVRQRLSTRQQYRVNERPCYPQHALSRSHRQFAVRWISVLPHQQPFMRTRDGRGDRSRFGGYTKFWSPALSHVAGRRRGIVYAICRVPGAFCFLGNTGTNNILRT
jgi:hypothetical protein